MVKANKCTYSYWKYWLTGVKHLLLVLVVKVRVSLLTLAHGQFLAIKRMLKSPQVSGRYASWFSVRQTSCQFCEHGMLWTPLQNTETEAKTSAPRPGWLSYGMRERAVPQTRVFNHASLLLSVPKPCASGPRRPG